MKSGRAVVVWGTWVVMLLLGIHYVASYGSNAPYYDEWGMVAVLEGSRSVDARWLWAAHNDHRIPIPKLALLGIYSVSGWDFRGAMFANVALLAAVAALLMQAAGRIRGRPAYSDAFFPLILLHWGHYENLLWGWQITQVIPVVIVLSVLVVMVRVGLRPAAATAVACSMAVIALPLCGVPGLVYAPALATWLVLVAWLRGRAGTNSDRRLAIALWGCAMLTLALIPLYFWGLTTTVRTTPEPLHVVGTMVAFLAQGFSPSAATIWPVAYLVVFMLGLSGFAVLLPALRSLESGRRERAVVLLLFLGGIAALALSVGVARPGRGFFPPRYFLQAVPALVWLYFAWQLFGAQRAARVANTALAAVALAASPLSYTVGLDYARTRSAAFAAFAHDLQQGMPPSRLIARHQRTLLPFPERTGAYWHGPLADSLRTLRAAGIGVFADLAPERPAREVPMSELATVRLNEEGIVGFFEPPLNLLGLRILPPRANSTVAPPYTTVDWRPAEADFAPERRYHHWWYVGERDAEVWIEDRVEALRIEIDDPAGEFAMPIILLLLPEETSELVP